MRAIMVPSWGILILTSVSKIAVNRGFSLGLKQSFHECSWYLLHLPCQVFTDPQMAASLISQFLVLCNFDSLVTGAGQETTFVMKQTLASHSDNFLYQTSLLWTVKWWFSLKHQDLNIDFNTPHLAQAVCQAKTQIHGRWVEGHQPGSWAEITKRLEQAKRIIKVQNMS